MSNQNNNLSQLVNQDFNSSHNSHQFKQQTEQYVTRNEFWEFKNNIENDINEIKSILKKYLKNYINYKNNSKQLNFF